MRVLLDTHVLLRALSAPSRLPAAARRVIDDCEVFVSVASVWEISIKSSIGKLAADPQEVLAALEPAGFLSLPVIGEHAAYVSRLPPIHRDPFDRLLLAQAITEPMRLLSDDAVLRGYGDVVMVV